jgi:hypothetical protein
MKAKTSAATLGLVGGLALGVWIGSEMTSGREAATPGPAVVATQTAEESAAPAPPPAKPKRVTSVARTRAAAAAKAPAGVPTTRASRRGVVASGSAPRLVMTIPVSAPELHARMKPVLARGTKLPLAAEGFSSAEQFAALAHASRNTQVPFILLKHRVLSEGQSLEEAIAASKPELDARDEAARARSAARSDIAALTSSAVASSS